MIGLIVTADDFGLAREVNEAVEQAHRSGVLTAASLMVAAPWAHDAVRRAHAMPGLRVGLHLVLVGGRAALPPHQVPRLVDAAGRLPDRMFGLAVRMALDARTARQLAQEIRAQFEAFAQTGLRLDHVNAHKHFQLHPTVARLIFRVGREFGLQGFRVPVEPAGLDGRRVPVRRLHGFAMRWGATLIRSRARAAGLMVPDWVYGLGWSGAMSERRLLRIVRALPRDGVAEIYMHPATRDSFPGSAANYCYCEELAALCSASVKDALRAPNIRLGGYADHESSGPRRP